VRACWWVNDCPRRHDTGGHTYQHTASGHNLPGGWHRGALDGNDPAAAGLTTPLAANGQDLVAISGIGTGGTLASLVDQPAAGQATVQSVISDEGFWVGTNE
jgi:hypothetical protein